jgi:Flp pilus assembly protein TadG
MVTAEFAVALPAFVLVVLAAVCAVAVTTAQLRCTDAAAAAARMAARGDSATQVRSAALSAAPGQASVEITGDADTVTATVRTTVSLPGPFGAIPGLTLDAHVVAAREPTASSVP